MQILPLPAKQMSSIGQQSRHVKSRHVNAHYHSDRSTVIIIISICIETELICKLRKFCLELNSWRCGIFWTFNQKLCKC